MVEYQKVAVAVSGGPDSLGLIFWAVKNFEHVHAITVDHKLRQESTAEVLYVKKILNGYNIESTILTWEHEKIKTGIQEKARTARYDLMVDWCKKNEYQALLVGHHLNDQLETFLMRLSKGSGIFGLGSMQKETCYKGVKILRPFIEKTSEELQSNMPYGITPIIDPSNEDLTYERVRYRKSVDSLLQNGFDLRGFQTSLEKINDVNAKIIEESEIFIKRALLYKNETNIVLDFAAIQSLGFVIFERVIIKLLDGMSKYKQIKNLYNKIRGMQFKRCTLFGHIITKKNDHLVITKETREK